MGSFGASIMAFTTTFLAQLYGNGVVVADVISIRHLPCFCSSAIYSFLFIISLASLPIWQWWYLPFSFKTQENMDSVGKLTESLLSEWGWMSSGARSRERQHITIRINFYLAGKIDGASSHAFSKHDWSSWPFDCSNTMAIVHFACFRSRFINRIYRRLKIESCFQSVHSKSVD